MGFRPRPRDLFLPARAETHDEKVSDAPDSMTQAIGVVPETEIRSIQPSFCRTELPYWECADVRETYWRCGYQ